MKVEVLYFSGCPNRLSAVERMRAVLEREGVTADVTEVEVRDISSAERLRFPGSPTILINGLDIEPAARFSHGIGWMCRTYIHEGYLTGIPPEEWIQAAVREAKDK